MEFHVIELLYKILMQTFLQRFDHMLFCTLQNSVAQLPLEELDRIQDYLQTSGLAQRYNSVLEAI